MSSYLLRVANLNAKAMFLNIQNKTSRYSLHQIKIDMSDEYTDGDKAQMMAFIRKNKNIQ
jgi:hypothetical protein